MGNESAGNAPEVDEMPGGAAKEKNGAIDHSTRR